MKERGVTLLELLVTVSIVLVLASVAMPLQKITSQRSQELELRQKLRELRMAIDEFRRDWSRDGEMLTGPLCTNNKSLCKDVSGVAGYPKSLKTLLGVEVAIPDSSSAEKKDKEVKSLRRYLRRIPPDPLTKTTDWGIRCYKDPADTQEWCGDDVFDVYSKSLGVGLDGTLYREW